MGQPFDPDDIARAKLKLALLPRRIAVGGRSVQLGAASVTGIASMTIYLENRKNEQTGS